MDIPRSRDWFEMSIIPVLWRFVCEGHVVLYIINLDRILEKEKRLMPI